jgi:ribosome maturation factor RimP
MSTRDAAVNLELCADVSRYLSPALDVVDLIPHAYQLEVSSPGVERPLRTERDFVRFAGQKVRLKRRLEGPASAGERVVVGLIDGVENGCLRVIDGKRSHEVPLSAVESARLVFEFGSAPPVKRGAHPAHHPHHPSTQGAHGARQSKSSQPLASATQGAEASPSRDASAPASRDATASATEEPQQRKH